MIRRTATLAAVLLAACGQPAEQPQAVATPAETAAPLPAPESLVGEYRVAAIDGEPLDAPFGIALSISETSVSFEAACAAFAWSYRYGAGKVELTRQPQTPTTAPCDEPVHPALDQLGGALDAVTEAGRTPENGIELSGEGRSVLLFSQ